MFKRELVRRRMLQGAALGAVGLWVWGIPRLPQLFAGPMRFRDIPGAPPYRFLEQSGSVTTMDPFLVGLDAPVQNDKLALVRANLTGVLFQGASYPSIALFSDFNCPNCPQMDANVQAVASEIGARVVHHQLPILGENSVLASLAVLAADAQGGHAAMYAALWRTPAIANMQLIRRLAQDAGLDADVIERDMRAPETALRLAQSQALADILGLIGTPAAVIGRTVVLGVLSEAQIKRIIALEDNEV